MATTAQPDLYQDKLAALQQALASDFRGEILTDDFSRALYATDASVYQQKPVMVALPREPEDLEALISESRAERIIDIKKKTSRANMVKLISFDSTHSMDSSSLSNENDKQFFLEILAKLIIQHLRQV